MRTVTPEAQAVAAAELAVTAKSGELKAATNTLKMLFGAAAPTLTDSQWESAAYTVLRNARANVQPKGAPDDFDSQRKAMQGAVISAALNLCGLMSCHEFELLVPGTTPALVVSLRESTQAPAPGAAPVPYAKFAELLRQEHALSDAYVRLRVILGAMDPPTVRDPAQLWTYVESVAREKLAAIQSPAVGDAALLRMVLDDMATCIGEMGRDYEFKELSTETVEALSAYRERRHD